MRRSFAALGFVALVVSAHARAGTIEAPTEVGPTGLLHVPSATTLAPGTVSGGLWVDAFSTRSFLCTRGHPCGATTSDRLRHTGAAATLGVGIVEGLDAYVVTRAWTDESSELDQLLEVLGETTLGVRFARPLRKRFALVGSLDAIAGGGPGDVGYSLGASSYRARLLSTFLVDPVRVHAALGYVFDN